MLAPPFFLVKDQADAQLLHLQRSLQAPFFFPPPVHVKQPRSRNHGLVGNSIPSSWKVLECPPPGYKHGGF